MEKLTSATASGSSVSKGRREDRNEGDVGSKRCLSEKQAKCVSEAQNCEIGQEVGGPESSCPALSLRPPFLLQFFMCHTDEPRWGRGCRKGVRVQSASGQGGKPKGDKGLSLCHSCRR